MQPMACPLCLRTTVELLSSNVKITVANEAREANGLLSCRCTEYGHVFFVRQSDLDSEQGVV